MAKRKDELRILTLGDLHWGAVPPARLEFELDEHLMPRLDEDIDAFIQLGDYYDQRLPLDSEDSKAALRFAAAVADACDRLGIPMRICKGGLAHDATQLSNLRALEIGHPSLRVITTAQHEELLEGFDVLWMPEEYPTDYARFYGGFFSDGESEFVYDAIFGHGEIDVAVSWGGGIESERHYGGTPCHSAELLLTHSAGPVQFGHVHNKFRYKKRLGYPGSFTRWAHGEEDPKGFEIITCRRDGDHWGLDRVELVTNTSAPRYVTRDIAEVCDVDDRLPVDEVIKAIDRYVTSNGLERLRVTGADGLNFGMQELAMLRGAFVGKRTVTFKAAPAAVSQEELAAGERAGGDEESARLGETIGYLRDQTVPGAERLLRYIREKHPGDTDVTLEDVLEVTSPLAA